MAFVLEISALPAVPDEQAAETDTGRHSVKGSLASPQQRSRRFERGPRRVFRDRVTPHWFSDNSRFWYRNDLPGGAREFVLVDALKGTREPAFDHQAVAKAMGSGAAAARLPIDEIECTDNGQQIILIGNGKRWQLNRATGQLQEAPEGNPSDTASGLPVEDQPRPSRRTGPETLITFDNRLAYAVEIHWIDAEGAWQSYGKVEQGARKDQHTFAGHVWLVTNERGENLGVFEATESPATAVIDGSRPPLRERRRRRNREDESASNGQSPDGNWMAFVKDHNVFIKSIADEQEFQLTTDGREGLAYGHLAWAPDSKTVVAFRIEPGERKEVFLVQSSPTGGGRARLHTRPYALPGDRFTKYELNLFDVSTRKQTKPQVDPFEHEWFRPRLHWDTEGRRLAYQQTDRGHQRFRVIEVDSHTGQVRNLIDERSDTFIWTAHTENLDLALVNWLDQTNEILYVSESSGWRHLYLIDATAGKLKNSVTSGEWVVRGIDLIDESARQVWFRASGVFPDQDPYLIHFGRVNFDGSGLVWLTAGNGNHDVQYSPDRKYIIDTYSRVDMAPVTELRRAGDGELVCRLEEADISELLATGWRPPEVFVAKGRDGKTDIWGIISRPRDFDPHQKYPVIEDIYAGPQGSFVPKTFSANSRYDDVTSLGFVVVKIDGMGTANRSKAFHDVCWKNLKDAGLADRILWMKAAAEKDPSLDLTRVGVYGNSAGGQNAAGALLFHPEFYKVAVASCGCHDNRMDKASWNEQWMGYPVGPQYAECSNIDNAHRLRGKLLLIVGEMDNNVPPESTMRFVEALIQAEKDFDLLVIPNGGHGMGGRYGQRRMQDFFVRHLLAQEPPDRNAEPAADTEVPTVTSVPDSFFDRVRERDRDAARQFYKKYIDVEGLPVVAAEVVADQALLRAHDIVKHMLAGRRDVLESMVNNGMYLIVIGKDQVYTDMPEYRNHPNPAYQNERVRGTGGKPTSFGEENLLSLPLDRYDDESIAVHEFSHTIDGALRSIDPAWTERRNAVFDVAGRQGLYQNAYASSNPGEYWAEICQAYFDCNRVNNWNHGPVGTREQLKVYDPAGYELVKNTFKLSPDQDWRYSFVQQLPNVIAPPAKFKLDPYYTKFTWAREFPVIGRGASDQAMLAANDTIRKMFAYRHDILKALIADGVKLVVLGRDEKLADLPEVRALHDSGPIDMLTRTLAYTPELKLLVVDERNVLAHPTEAHSGDNQVIRVMANAIHSVTGTRPVDPNWDSRPRRDWQQYELRVQRLDIRFDEKLKELYENSLSAGKWRGTSAVHHRASYWAAGVLAYFDAAGQDAAPTDAAHPILTREALKEYDPGLFSLVSQTMAYESRVDWRYRQNAEPSHGRLDR
jgi:dipeptidyl aminopeptidase/acylaminoacyl peptidase